MKGYALLLLAIVAGTHGQYYYPQPVPAFDFPTTQPPTTRPPPPPPTQPAPTNPPVTVPNVEYLPPIREEQAVIAEEIVTLPPTTRPPPPPPTTTRPTPPPATRPPPPPPTTRPPPPPTTTRPSTTQAPTTPPAYYIPPVQAVEEQAQIVFVTSAPTTPPPPPTTTTRPPPPPTTTTQAPTTRRPVTTPAAPAQGGYNYPKPEPEFSFLSDAANDNTLILIPTTTTTSTGRPPVAPVEAAPEEHHHHHDDHHLFWDFRESIPGEPGQDYPILDTIPATGFSCNGRTTGYYADVEAKCQVFHVCVENPNGAAIQNSFLCPNGTIFNQKSFACEWWTDVDCQASSQFYALNENIGKVPEKPSTTARSVPAPPARNQPVLDSASSVNQQQIILIPVANSAAPSVKSPVYEKPSQLYDAPPVAASRVDTVGLKPPSAYRK